MVTKFQQSVWEAINSIPRGKVASYGSIARMIGRPNAIRAVGTAVGKNPKAPRVPCHRIVKSDGSIGKYSGEGGVKSKIDLLKSEGVDVENGKIVNFKKRLSL